MKKKTGFTLIELLAVIVILAIIALIAVPVIMNIISKARNSAFEDTAYGLISAGEMYYAEKLLDAQGMTQDVEFEIENGSFKGENKLNVSGSLPTNGKITVTKDGKVAIAVDNGAYCITKATTESGITVIEKDGACDYRRTANPLFTTKDEVTAVHTCATSGTCDVGTQFAVQVSPTKKEIFRVIKDENNIVTLLMDSDLGSGVAWINEEDYIAAGGQNWHWYSDYYDQDYYGNGDKGPITALNVLEERTSGWINLPKGYTTTDYYGQYSAISKTGARARLVKLSEIESLYDEDGLPDWSYSTEYWTSEYNSNQPDHAGCVLDSGYVYDDMCKVFESYGLRPVIEIPKSII